MGKALPPSELVSRSYPVVFFGVLQMSTHEARMCCFCSTPSLKVKSTHGVSWMDTHSQEDRARTKVLTYLVSAPLDLWERVL